MYRAATRAVPILGTLVLGSLAACGKPAPPVRDDASHPRAVPAVAAIATPDAAPADPNAFADLASALRAIIPADARVIGIGELHNRTDRAQVRSTLAAFTDVVPVIGDHISDLVVETWVVDPKCGQSAVTATAKVETAVRRPAATKNDITLLAEAARAQQIQPHAMTLTCDDYKRIAPPTGSAGAGEIDPSAMLTLTTRELTRIATSAIRFRDQQPDHRPWIVVYGGALHNDRFPDPAVAEWSYAAAVDKASGDHFVEIDLIVPELAEADAASQKKPWFDAVTHADKRVHVVKMGERSFVVILPRTTAG